MIQNIGQLLASREESLYNLAGPKKRNYMSMAGDIASIPSTETICFRNAQNEQEMPNKTKVCWPLIKLLTWQNTVF